MIPERFQPLYDPPPDDELEAARDDARAEEAEQGRRRWERSPQARRQARERIRLGGRP